ILPAGTEKVGKFEYNVELNASPKVIAQLNDLPVRKVNGTIVTVRDVAYVHDGSPPQTNIVRMDGARAVMMTIQKAGTASTLDIIAGVKALLPRIRQSLPDGVQISLIGDQSVFVTAAVSGVIREGAMAAALTGLMILLFLGSWRSTVIITVSIPLAVLASIAALSALGETINVMTLGGLALAVGILVDDATVTIENINWHLEMGKDITSAILEGAQQIVTPAFVSLLCICIVFVPMFTLSGVARFLFVPMAEAVIFALVSSFVLSRTLVPTMARYLLPEHAPHEAGAPRRTRNPLVRFQHGFEARFTAVRQGYYALLRLAVLYPKRFIGGFLALVVLSFGLAPWLGQNFFPAVDAGQIKLHVRAQTGTRIEETARLCDEIESRIRDLIPRAELEGVVDNLGLPVSGINMAYNNSGTIGPEDADIYITLKPDHHPTSRYVRQLREQLPQLFPGTGFAFLPADIVTQILNFGLPAPIDVQVIGPRLADNRAYADRLLNAIRTVPGVADLRMEQAFNQPALHVDVNRAFADEVGLTQRDVATSLLTSLAGSGQTAPTFWLNPENGVSYPVIVQTPQYRMDSWSDLRSLPVTSGASNQLLGALATITRGPSDGVVSHYNAQPAIDLYAATQGRDLGAVAADIRKILADTQGEVPKGSFVVLRGQVDTMQVAYAELFAGLAGAIVLIYLLIVVNFQSWLDPFVIIMGLPGALAGIVWMLFITHTTLSVPALTGAILCMGVATANSILVVSFARERLAAGAGPVRAALEAGLVRFRPVMMTALAMVIGMAPMALGLGEGGEQNAPLGRAVIGGLIVATCATLFFVPTLFSLVHGRKQPARQRAGALHLSPSNT
ncbi:MAG TPA: efflux RND transporter permease subunit, partial [Rhodopila sp.]|nr:efflux RND transporter permease subunit [Rhodopila sp.]